MSWNFLLKSQTISKLKLKILPKADSEINVFFIEAVLRRCSVKKGVLRDFAKFTGKHLCQGLFFNKIAGHRPATLLKKRL